MSAFARRRKGWASPSSLPEHDCYEPPSGLHAKWRRMTVAMNVIVVSASIAVYCSQARITDGISDGKFSAPRREVIFPSSAYTLQETIEWE